MSKKYSNIILRLGTGLVGIPLIVGLLYWNEWSYFFLFLIILIGTLLEFYGLINNQQPLPRSIRIWGVLFAVLLYTLSFMYAKGSMPGTYYGLTLPMLTVIYLMMLYKKNTMNPFSSIAHIFLGIIYVGMPFALLHFIAFDNTIYHYEFVLGILIIVWMNDIGAYVVGSLLGKHQLFKRISPKKTWEGTIGGALLALLVSYLIACYDTSWSIVQWMIIGMITVIAGPYGDLVESLFKRSLQIKDSGTIIPGHGGFLDRFDSLLLTVPLIVAFNTLGKNINPPKQFNQKVNITHQLNKKIQPENKYGPSIE